MDLCHNCAAALTNPMLALLAVAIRGCRVFDFGRAKPLSGLR